MLSIFLSYKNAGQSLSKLNRLTHIYYIICKNYSKIPYSNMSVTTGNDIMERIRRNLRNVQSKIYAQCQKHSKNYDNIRLVAVSKTQLPPAVIAAYEAIDDSILTNDNNTSHNEDDANSFHHYRRQRHFGENYVNELVEKATNANLLQACPDIRWHFIGRLQKSNVNKLLNVPRLAMIETIDSQKIADAVNGSLQRRSDAVLRGAALKKSSTSTIDNTLNNVTSSSMPSMTLNNSDDANESSGAVLSDTNFNLDVMVQVNTSGEHNKNGIEPENCTDLVSHIMKNCPRLHFVGLMTIGALARSQASSAVSESGENIDFRTLVDCRKHVCKILDLPEDAIELSMGMSSDYETAIVQGSTNVRIGSTIFGARQK